MKLTVELDDALVKKAEAVAAARGRTLDALIRDVLERETANGAPGKDEDKVKGRVELPVYRPTPGKEGLTVGLRGSVDKPRELLEEVDGPDNDI